MGIIEVSGNAQQIEIWPQLATIACFWPQLATITTNSFWQLATNSKIMLISATIGKKMWQQIPSRNTSILAQGNQKVHLGDYFSFYSGQKVVENSPTTYIALLFMNET